jgi:hypothetical protein
LSHGTNDPPYGAPPGSVAETIANAVHELAATMAAMLDPVPLADLRFADGIGNSVTLEQLLDDAITIPQIGAVASSLSWTAPDLSSYVSDLEIDFGLIGGPTFNLAAPIQDMLNGLEFLMTGVVNGLYDAIASLLNSIIAAFNTWIAGPNGVFELLTDVMINLGINFADFMTQFVYKDVFRDFVLKWIMSILAYGLRVVIGIPAYKIGAWVMENLVSGIDNLNLRQMVGSLASTFFSVGDEGLPTDWNTFLSDILAPFTVEDEGPRSTTLSTLLHIIKEQIFSVPSEAQP